MSTASNSFAELSTHSRSRKQGDSFSAPHAATSRDTHPKDWVPVRGCRSLERFLRWLVEVRGAAWAMRVQWDRVRGLLCPPPTAEGRCTICFFFSRSWAANTLCGSLDQFDLALTSATQASTTQSAPQAQSPQIKASLHNPNCRCCKRDASLSSPCFLCPTDF